MYQSTQNATSNIVDFDVDANGNLFSHTQTTTDTYTPVDVGGFAPQIANLNMDIAGLQAVVDDKTKQIADKQAMIDSLNSTAIEIVKAVPTLAEKLTLASNEKTSIVADPATPAPAIPATDTQA